MLALAAITALGFLFRVVERYDPARKDALAAGGGSVRLAIDDATMAGNSGGKPDWRLRAHRVVMRADPGGDLEAFRQVELAGISDGELYERHVKRATFRADSAVYDRAARSFTIAGGIQLVSTRGDRIESSDCIWSERDDFIRFPSGASGTYKRNTLKAPSLLYAPRERMIQCPAGAEGVFEGHPVRAAAITWDVENERVHCTGPVTGTRRNLDYTASSADIDLKTRTLRVNKGLMHLRIQPDSEGPEAFE